MELIPINGKGVLLVLLGVFQVLLGVLQVLPEMLQLLLGDAEGVAKLLLKLK